MIRTVAKIAFLLPLLLLTACASFDVSTNESRYTATASYRTSYHDGRVDTSYPLTIGYYVDGVYVGQSSHVIPDRFDNQLIDHVESSLKSWVQPIVDKYFADNYPPAPTGKQSLPLPPTPPAPAMDVIQQQQMEIISIPSSCPLGPPHC